MTTSPTSAPAVARGRLRHARMSGVTQYAGFLPALVLFGVFFVVPLGLIVAYSFWQTVDYNVVHDWTFDNYHYFFSVSTYVSTMWATIWVAVAATAATIAIAFPFTYWLVPDVPRRLPRPFLFLVILPLLTSYLTPG